jgi:hypothetical protein
MMWAEQFSQQHPHTGGFAGQLTKSRDIVYDLRCPDLDGDPCYYILKIEPAKHERFLVALESNLRFNMSDYGELMYFGRGEPEDELKSYLRDTYGMYRSDA